MADERVDNQKQNHGKESRRNDWSNGVLKEALFRLEINVFAILTSDTLRLKPR